MPELEKYFNDIERLCVSHNVKNLYAFGSILTSEFNKESDIDFLVNFNHVDIKQYADNYYDFKFSLENILKRPVDLLEEKAIKNPYFLQAVNKKRKLVYGH